ncbi:MULTISPECIES: ComF family protein [unclassified Aureispira]|uniref:ComF family protein n=1 Tax=unclassified Aureispira TaxID=2649989 RepID=UPI000698062F|nr:MULTISPECIES: ComF family protein [unclassified Aureispira]WMX14942.1 ComF family protein [Aureispira sp. CCB-E]
MQTPFQILSKPLLSLVNLFYPRLCFACQKNLISEQTSICIHCNYKLTPTNYHCTSPNPVLERFWGRVELVHATTAYSFSKGGILQHLIHQLKYENKPQIGIELGKMYGSILKDSPLYSTVDYIIPVPLHPKKKRLRGYNQAAMIAKGLAISMGTKWSSEYLIRTNNTETQTKKSRLDRFANVEHAFEIGNGNEIEGKHLLLVDDVITTGATLEACTQTLLQVNNTKVSVAAIALAN